LQKSLFRRPNYANRLDCFLTDTDTETKTLITPPDMPRPTSLSRCNIISQGNPIGSLQFRFAGQPHRLVILTDKVAYFLTDADTP
jgi:hypothetical protein